MTDLTHEEAIEAIINAKGTINTTVEVNGIKVVSQPRSKSRAAKRVGLKLDDSYMIYSTVKAALLAGHEREDLTNFEELLPVIIDEAAIPCSGNGFQNEIVPEQCDQGERGVIGGMDELAYDNNITQEPTATSDDLIMYREKDQVAPWITVGYHDLPNGDEYTIITNLKLELNGTEVKSSIDKVSLAIHNWDEPADFINRICLSSLTELVTSDGTLVGDLRLGLDEAISMPYSSFIKWIELKSSVVIKSDITHDMPEGLYQIDEPGATMLSTGTVEFELYDNGIEDGIYVILPDIESVVVIDKELIPYKVVNPVYLTRGATSTISKIILDAVFKPYKFKLQPKVADGAIYCTNLTQVRDELLKITELDELISDITEDTQDANIFEDNTDNIIHSAINHDEIQKCKDDPLYFMERYVRIESNDDTNSVSPMGVLMPVKLTPAIRNLASTMKAGSNIVSYGSRQTGVTTQTILKTVFDMIDTGSAVVIGSNDMISQTICDKITSMYRRLPKYLRDFEKGIVEEYSPQYINDMGDEDFKELLKLPILIDDISRCNISERRMKQLSSKKNGLAAALTFNGPKHRVSEQIQFGFDEDEVEYVPSTITESILSSMHIIPTNMEITGEGNIIMEELDIEATFITSAVLKPPLSTKCAYLVYPDRQVVIATELNHIISSPEETYLDLATHLSMRKELKLFDGSLLALREGFVATDLVMVYNYFEDWTKLHTPVKESIFSKIKNWFLS